jgi:hypothetical protein
MIISSTKAVPFLDKLLVFVKIAVSESGIRAPSNTELFAKAARWQGYTILDGFVPVRKMTQRRLATPKKSKALVSCAYLFVIFLQWLFILLLSSVCALNIRIMNLI